jgi:hypothetical protein
MPQQSPVTAPMPSLTRTEADRRKAILGLLQNALAARRISSVLAGRRTLVLRSGQGRERSGACGGPATPADPQLYVFAAGDVHIVTTDGEVYWFTGGCAHSVADPGGAARVYGKLHTRRAKLSEA